MRVKHLHVLTESAVGSILSRVDGLDEGADEAFDLSSISDCLKAFHNYEHLYVLTGALSSDFQQNCHRIKLPHSITSIHTREPGSSRYDLRTACVRST